MSDAEKDRFIDEYFAHEGIRLDPSRVAYNMGLRATMKIILNSLWGKFGQRGNMVQSKICFEPSEFYKLVLNDRYEISGMFQVIMSLALFELYSSRGGLLCSRRYDCVLCVVSQQQTRHGAAVHRA